MLQAETISNKEQQERLHALLWNQATRRFQMKGYEEAIPLFEADLQYAPKAEKSRVARTLAMCSLGLKKYDR